MSHVDDVPYGRRILTALVALVAAAAPLGAEALHPAFKIYVADSGIYRVGFEDLAAAGLTLPGLPSSGLGLTHLGVDVPVRVEDSGDGRFDPGDWIEFVGEHLPGEVSYFNERARYNVYRLRTDAVEAARMTLQPVAGRPRVGDAQALLRAQHLEEDKLFIRLRRSRTGPEELWYWAKLVRGHEAFHHEIDLSDLQRDSARNVDLAIHLRGWSQPRHKGDAAIPDHRVDVVLNGRALTSAEWNGPQPFLLELPGLARKLFEKGPNVLELSVPKRRQADGEILVDVVLLNWIEVISPRSARIGDHQARVRLAEPSSSRPICLVSGPGADLVVYGKGWWASSAPAKRRSRKRDVKLVVFPEVGESSLVVTAASRLAAPVFIALDRPSRLADVGNRADYIMITHERLREAIAPLAELHRRRGLAVTVVDAEDVYDEFSHGIRDPAAIRLFLEYAYHHWSRPAPRFVLLVGDASWDVKNDLAIDENYADWTNRPWETTRFAKNGSTPYDGDAWLNHRNYVPTLSYFTSQGHTASDNGFVAVDGDDDLPDMAIGRFPVTESSEVSAIVEKTRRYIEEPEIGPWQRNVLFITNEMPAFQRRSDRVATELSAAGYEPLKIYPASAEASNEHHTARLLEAFDEGALFVHFLGHGGRYIWRTGPPDLKKNHDLLTLEHLDRLSRSPRLPVVLSLTCYSAPFDHPSADSIGEKFLRVPDRGAIGMIAASWRNSPQPTWGEALLAELTSPGATVGEALMRAKHRVRHRIFVNTYNLLGDPAVPVALPSAGSRD